jgi:1-phosphofructokinase family hexose kinase
MIYTVTLNPSLDTFYFVEDLKYDDVNRVVELKKYAGGKGINVSKVISELRGETFAFSFSGKFIGDELEEILTSQGIKTNFVRIQDETRANIIIRDKNKNTQTELNSPGPNITADELNHLLDSIFAYKTPDFLVLAGSLPCAVAVDTYAKIIKRAKKENIKVMLDADGDQLKLGIKEKPFMIKPNIYETERLLNRKINRDDDKEIIEIAKSFVNDGIEIVAISRGPKGVIVAAKNEIINAIPPDVSVQSTIGAGDSFIAGFLLEFAKSSNLVEAVRLGVACGSASAMAGGTALCRKEDVEKLLDKVEIKV